MGDNVIDVRSPPRTAPPDLQRHGDQGGSAHPETDAQAERPQSGVLKLGKSLTAKGTVTPTSLAGSTVTLTVQRKQGGKWLKVTSLTPTISAKGAYSATYKPAKKGSYRIEATIAKTATNAAAATKWLTFKVK